MGGQKIRIKEEGEIIHEYDRGGDELWNPGIDCCRRLIGWEQDAVFAFKQIWHRNTKRVIRSLHFGANQILK